MGDLVVADGLLQAAGLVDDDELFLGSGYGCVGQVAGQHYPVLPREDHDGHGVLAALGLVDRARERQLEDVQRGLVLVVAERHPLVAEVYLDGAVVGVDAADYTQIAVEHVMGIAVLGHHDLVAWREAFGGSRIEGGPNRVVEGLDAG